MGGNRGVGAVAVDADVRVPVVAAQRVDATMRAIALFALLLAGCVQVRQVPWTRIDGARCLTTKVKPVWYSSETSTDCMDKGEAVAIRTEHEDLSILGGAAALLGIVLGATGI